MKKCLFPLTLIMLVLRPATFAQSTTELRVGLTRGGHYTITMLPLETYVARVLAGEAARGSPPAALEALAITIRTFALANLGRHRADGFDLCDQTHCQVLGTATAATERAARVTAGQLLLRDGAPASVYYTASCGGRTEIPSAVWPGAQDPSFLPSQDDDACGGRPQWTAQIGESDLARALRAAGFRGGRLKDLRIMSRNHSGRVARLRVDGFRPEEISGQDLRLAVGRTLGWQHIKSTAFDLGRQSGGYRFAGHGSGHGVGLCVIGSAQLAAQGQSASDILSRYFPGLRISTAEPPNSVARAPARGRAPTTLPPPGATSDVVVSLPYGDEGERDFIARLTVQARDELARALDVSTPSRLTLRFHPTVGDYERATGQPWFTTGAVVNGELHLPPLAELRDRGVLDRAIRHELVLIMTEGVLADRPVWVREGAAIYFGGDQPIPGEPPTRPAIRLEPRATCPNDQELLRPVSVGAMTNAYARARACFARQIEARKSWRDVK